MLQSHTSLRIRQIEDDHCEFLEALKKAKKIEHGISTTPQRVKELEIENESLRADLVKSMKVHERLRDDNERLLHLLKVYRGNDTLSHVQKHTKCTQHGTSIGIWPNDCDIDIWSKIDASSVDIEQKLGRIEAEAERQRTDHNCADALMYAQLGLGVRHTLCGMRLAALPRAYAQQIQREASRAATKKAFETEKQRMHVQHIAMLEAKKLKANGKQRMPGYLSAAGCKLDQENAVETIENDSDITCVASGCGTGHDVHERAYSENSTRDPCLPFEDRLRRFVQYGGHGILEEYASATKVERSDNPSTNGDDMCANNVASSNGQVRNLKALAEFDYPGWFPRSKFPRPRVISDPSLARNGNQITQLVDGKVAARVKTTAKQIQT
jgi:hypothetical protein